MWKNDQVTITMRISADGAWLTRIVRTAGGDSDSRDITGNWSQTGDSITVVVPNKPPPITVRSIDATHVQWIGGSDPNDRPIFERVPDK